MIDGCLVVLVLVVIMAVVVFVALGYSCRVFVF